MKYTAIIEMEDIRELIESSFESPCHIQLVGEIKKPIKVEFEVTL